MFRKVLLVLGIVDPWILLWGSTGGLLPPAVAAESLRLAAAGSHLLRMSDPFSPIQLLRL
jgi:hypothetical protein